MGNGEWGMGNGEKMLFIIPHSLLPITYSLFPSFSKSFTRSSGFQSLPR
jgi:hypothetical protein